MQLSRRAVLTGLPGLTGLIGLSCRGETDESVALPYTKPPIGRPRNLIVVQAYGGWDTTYSIDPKPDQSWMDIAPGEVREFGGLPIWVHPQRPATATLFDRHHERLAIVHGINVRSVDHTQCLRWILTGTRDPAAPDLCAIAAAELGAEMPIPYLLLSDRAFLGDFGSEAARSGASNQIASLADPQQRYLPIDGTAPFSPSSEEQGAIDTWRAARVSAPHGTLGARVSARPDAPLARARAVGLKAVADWLGVAGQPQDLSGQVQTALAILEGGLTRAVMLDSLAYFDTHGRIEEQVTAQESTFAAVDNLLTELASRPGREGGTLLDETVVAVISEMGRTPVLNETGGKDHWPFASILLAGAGIAGDKVYGATDDQFLGVPVDLATGMPSSGGTALAAENITAGLLAAVGVDPEPWVGRVPALHGFYQV